MSYACIDQEELDRRGLCDGVRCSPPIPTIIRETIVEPIFVDSFLSPPPPLWGGGWFGGGRRHHHPRRRPPVWHPRAPGQHHGVSSGPNTVVGRPGRRVGGTVDRGPQDDFPRGKAPSTSIAHARPSSPSYAAVPNQYTARPMAPPAQRYQAAPTTYTTRPMAPSAPRTTYHASTTYTARPMRQQAQTVYRAAPTTYSKSLKGLGQAIAEGVTSRWKYMTVGLAALAVAQFFWWNAKAPWVLRGKSY